MFLKRCTTQALLFACLLLLLQRPLLLSGRGAQIKLEWSFRSDGARIGKISGKIGKAALDAVFEGQGGGDSDRRGEEEEVVAVSVETPMEIVERNGWMVINDSGEVHKLCRAVVDDPAFATQLEQFRSGEKPKLRGFFIGQVMKRSKGQADPQEVGKALGELL